MNKKICVFGPPCVGKTTLTYTALKNKIPSFTTHSYYKLHWPVGRESRKEFVTHVLNLDIPLFLDSGGLDINWINGEIDGGVNAKTVLLLPPRDVYLERERIEIEEWGENRNQDGLKNYDNFTELKPEFDLVIEDVLSPQEILDYIIEKTGVKK